MNAQNNAMNQVFGMGGVPMGGYPAPPMMGVPGANPYGPHMAHVQMAQANAMNQATKSVGFAMIAVVVGIVLVTLVMVGAGIAFYAMAR
jgi:hypothetical protein